MAKVSFTVCEFVLHHDPDPSYYIAYDSAFAHCWTWYYSLQHFMELFTTTSPSYWVARVPFNSMKIESISKFIVFIITF